MLCLSLFLLQKQIDALEAERDAQNKQIKDLQDANERLSAQLQKLSKGKIMPLVLLIERYPED